MASIYSRQEDFFALHPGLEKVAMVCINTWGKGEISLTHAVAQALLDAHAAGASGQPLYGAPPARQVMRRTPPPATTSAVTQVNRVVRRTR